MGFFTLFCKLVFVCYVTSYWNVSSAIPVYPEEGKFFEGDILEPLPTIDPKSGLIDIRFRWPNNELIYEFDAGFAEASRTRFMSGLNHIVGRTCIRFKRRTTETDYVRVFQGSGCYSYVGRIGGRQDLSLGNGCVFMGTIVHEVIHAIGLYHEQSRSDRDNYVIINWDNIAEDKHHNFGKWEDTMVSPFNAPYDYSSIMHYIRTAFSKNGLDTITVKSGAEIGHRSAMSNLDWTKVNNMFKTNEVKDF